MAGDRSGVGRPTSGSVPSGAGCATRATSFRAAVEDVETEATTPGAPASATALAEPRATPGTCTSEFTEDRDGLFDELLDDNGRGRRPRSTTCVATTSSSPRP